MNDFIAAKCPSCSNDLRVRLEYAGHKVSCKSCGGVFTVPMPSATASALSPGPATDAEQVGNVPKASQEPTGTELVRFDCPNCAKTLKMRRDQVGATVSCKRCQHVFKTSVANLATTSETPPLAGDRHDTAWKERVESLEKENSSLRDERDGLRGENDRLRQDLVSTRTEHESSGSAIPFFGLEGQRDADQELTSLRAEVFEVRADRERDRLAHESELSHLRAGLKAAESIAEAAAGKTEEVSGLKEDLLALRREFAIEGERVSQETALQRGEWESKLRSFETDREAQLREVAQQAEALKIETEVLRSQLEKAQASTDTVVNDARENQCRLRAEKESAIDERDGLKTELERLRADFSTADEEHGGSIKEWEQRETSHRADEERQQAEIERLRTECLGFSDKIDELIEEIARIRAEREHDKRAHEERMAAFRDDWGRERQAWVSEAERAALVTRELQEANSRSIAELNEQLREAREHRDQGHVGTEHIDPFRQKLEAELAEKSVEVEELRMAVFQAQTFKTQIGTFLSGLGIRLPT